MFIENKISYTKKTGWVEVIVGSMFSGKTEELLRRLRRAVYAKQSVEIFKPLVDNRYSDDEVVSHDSNAIHSTPVTNSANILLLASNVDVIGIDEAQFFDNNLIDTCNKLANSGTRVIVAGLDMDYMGRPFGPIPSLIASAEFITKVHAICVRCGNPAQFSYRKTDDNNLVMLGETEEYEPLCRHCYNEANLT